MKKLDRLGWTAGIAFKAYGLSIGIRTNTPRVPRALLDALPWGWKPARSNKVDWLYSLYLGGKGARAGRRAHVLFAGSRKVIRTVDLAKALAALRADLQAYTADNAVDRLFVRAGVVGWKGRAIVLPGCVSGRGALLSALLRAGATYYSDEFAVLDERGYVHPFPRISVREVNGRTRAPGVRIGKRAIQVGLVVETDFRVRGRPPRTPSPGQAVLSLLSNTVAARSQPEMALAFLSRAMEGAVAVKVAAGQPEEIAAQLLKEI